MHFLKKMLLIYKKKLSPALVLIGDNYINPKVTYARNSAATCFVNNVLTSFASGVPRFGVQQLGDTYNGFISESAGTNYCSQSEDIGSWSLFDISAVSSADTNLGTAWCITEDTSDAQHVALMNHSVIDTAVGQVRTLSVYLKAGTASKIRISDKSGYFEYADHSIGVDLVAKTAVAISWPDTSNITLTECTNGWFLLTFSITFYQTGGFQTFSVQMANDDFSSITYTGTGKTFYFCKPQIEIAAFPSSYISTGTGSVAATRAADSLVVNNVNMQPWFDRICSTFFVDFKRPALVNQAGGLVVVTDAAEDFNNYTQLTCEAALGYTQYQTRYEGVTNSQTAHNAGVNVRSKVAITIKPDDAAMALGGVMIGQDTSCIMPLVTKMNLGCRFDGLELNGTIQSLVYYKERLPDSQLISMTS